MCHCGEATGDRRQATDILTYHTLLCILASRVCICIILCILASMLLVCTYSSQWYIHTTTLASSSNILVLGILVLQLVCIVLLLLQLVCVCIVCIRESYYYSTRVCIQYSSTTRVLQYVLYAYICIVREQHMPYAYEGRTTPSGIHNMHTRVVVLLASMIV